MPQCADTVEEISHGASPSPRCAGRSGQQHRARGGARRHRGRDQRRAFRPHRRPADATPVVSARRVVAHRHQVRRRARRERFRPGAGGRQAGVRDHPADGEAGRQAHHHGGRPGRERRRPAPAAAGLHRRGRDRLRLLHAGLADRRRGPAETQAATHGRRHRPVDQHLPLRLPDPGARGDQARRRRQGGPGMSARTSNGAATNGLRLSRRRFLQILAGTAGALVVGVRMARADETPLPPEWLGNHFQELGAYVRIDAEGNVLIGARDPDTGTGVATALPMIIADELDADWNRVSVVPLGLGVSANDNGQPRWTYGRQRGGTGDSIPAAWAELRQAGALARWLLTQAAARRLGIAADRLRCEAGTVIAPDGRRVTYGSLVDDASKLDLPTQTPAPKAPERYTLIGKPVGDVGAHAIVTGQAKYAIDHHEAEALVAVLLHCPWPDGSLSSIDTAPALAVKGVVKVMHLKPEPGQPPGHTVIAPAVAVLAENTWAALVGRDKLKLEWKPGAAAGTGSGALEQQAIALLDSKAAPTTRVRDD